MEDGGLGLLPLLLFTALAVLCIAAGWRIFTKAGQPGWAALIPIYNAYVLLNIVGRPIWWLLLMFVPIVNLIVALVLNVDLAKSFGKGTGFGIGLFILGFIFAPLLAFGDATYQGPAAAADEAATRPTPAVQ